MNKTARTLVYIASIAVIFLIVRFFLMTPQDCSQASPQAAAEQLVTLGKDALGRAHAQAVETGQTFTCPDNPLPDLPGSDACFSHLSLTASPEARGCRLRATVVRAMDNLNAMVEDSWRAE